eukprot:scaffold70204_cov63-Phaeocystis_antarctica.AAC.2
MVAESSTERPARRASTAGEHGVGGAWARWTRGGGLVAVHPLTMLSGPSSGAGHAIVVGEGQPLLGVLK